MDLSLPRITVSALRGGSGKTIISLGLLSLWREMGLSLSPFKKGPDFIDAGWLAFASGTPCYNLDPFLMTGEQILYSFLIHTKQNQVSLIEGNRGLFDGVDLYGSCSTAQLAKTLSCPVLLIVDATMVTRTTAALVKGCQSFDPDLKLAGIVINQVATKRQEKLIRESIEHYCNVPVLGAIPRSKENPFPQRHMGLVPHHESSVAQRAIDWTKKLVSDNVDLQRLLQIMKNAGPIHLGPSEKRNDADEPLISGTSPTIGVIRDSVFWFYYPENIDSLKSLGAEIVEINSIRDSFLPEIDALYIGGGFPETQAEALAENLGFREELKKRINDGLPVYAECGGFMFMGKNLKMGDKSYPMAGVLPVTFVLEKKPQGHGYTLLETMEPNPYYTAGERIKGHEFHYSRPIVHEQSHTRPVFKVLRGHGLDGTYDGLQKKNLLATYTHVHAGGDTKWATRIYHVAATYRTQKNFGVPQKKN